MGATCESEALPEEEGAYTGVQMIQSRVRCAAVDGFFVVCAFLTNFHHESFISWWSLLEVQHIGIQYSLKWHG